jgi:cohesin loading factor subunit SCC2
LSRILKILERSVRAGVDIDPFRSIGAQLDKPGTPRRNNKKKSNGKGIHTVGEVCVEEPLLEYAMVVDESVSAEESNELDLDKFSDTLDVAKDSVLAADCCIALLGSDRLPKQVSHFNL